MVDNDKKVIIPDILEGKVIPKSIAIIMDGNGRYATKNNLPRELGHKAGCEALEVILEECVRLGVAYLTVYAFSTENWKRSEHEISSLMSLFKLYMPKITKSANENDVRVRFIGDISKFSKDIYDLCKKLESDTKDNKRATFSVAFNYGGRAEIIHAVNDIIKDNDVKEITEEDFSKRLYTYDIMDPDLVIRTSGEYRISNFLLWQSAYSEYYFTEKLWPEFDKDELYKAIIEYNKRERRYGGRK